MPSTKRSACAGWSLWQKAAHPLLSVPASYLNGERKAIIRDAFRRASQPQPTARPLDWHETTCPAVWKLGEETKHFDWTEPCGILTGSI